MLDLPDGYYDIRRGTLVNVVTCLEMHAPPPPRGDPPGVRARLRRVERPSNAWYRALYHKVGDEYLWFSRLALDDAALRAILDDDRVEVYSLSLDGSDEGLVELDFREEGECELSYFALAAPSIGAGIGRWMMNRAIERAWSRPIRRFWVHTCTLDHPDAVRFYERSGFVPFKRQVEFAPDPRSVGLVPREAAPRVPLL